jgi:hypothetical protein
MSMVLTAFPAEYDASITTKVADGIAAAPMTFLEYCNVSDDARAVIKLTNYSGFGDVPQWKDGESLPLDEALKIGDQTLTMLFYGMGFVVTRQHVRYGEMRTINGWANSLARSAVQTMGVAGANLLNNAFTTTHSHFGTKTLCSTTHTTAGAGTRSNRGAGAALTPANWETLAIQGLNWVNYRGLNDAFEVNRMVVPPALRRIAKKILGSDGEPSTTDNDLNTHKGSCALTIEPKLSSTTAYFGLEAGVAELEFIFGQRPTPIRYTTDGEQSLVHGLAFDFVTGIGKPDGVIGDAGA